MEVKINREIRNYTESMFSDCPCGSSFFCLRLRGCGRTLFSAPSVHGNRDSKLGVYLRGSAFCCVGIFKYHGMTAEQFLWAWFKSEFLIPKKLVFRSENLYYELLKGEIEAREKEELKKHD